MSNLPFCNKLQECLLAIIVALAIVPTNSSAQNAATGGQSAPRVSPHVAAGQLPPGGVWTRTVKADGSGETWGYNFTIGGGQNGGDVQAPAPRSAGPSTGGGALARRADVAGRASQGPGVGPGRGDSALNRRTLPPPSFGGLIQRRFVVDSDPRQPSSVRAPGWYEVWVDASDAAASPGEVVAPISTGEQGWVRVAPDTAASLSARGIRYRRVMPDPLAGVPGAGSIMTVETGARPAAAHLASRSLIAPAALGRPGLSAFDINFGDQPKDRQVSSVRFYLRLSHPHLDQVTVWLAAGNREAVLWDGRGGSDAAGFDDGGKNDPNITLNRVLSTELKGIPLSGHWTLYVSNGDPHAAGTLEEFWLLAAGARPAALKAEAIRPAAVTALDIIALTAYMDTSAGGTGSVVSAPSVGQTVYLTLDWELTGASGSMDVSEEAILDGTTYCTGDLAATNALWTSWCPTGWVATAGSHTIEFALNYDDSVVESNYNNDTAFDYFSVGTTVDIAAQTAYLMTGVGDTGSEVYTPSVGESVYFTVDYEVTGASGSINVDYEALLDGSVFCSGSFADTNNTYTGWCLTPWVATAGSHTLEWDLNYDDSVVESNYNNDTAFYDFSTAGTTVDIIAQQAYLMTGADSGSTVVTPSVGESVYFTVDYEVTGASGFINVDYEALLDGSVFCSGSFADTNNTYTGWCLTPWVATAGSHTLEWDLNYDDSVVESNYNNDTAFDVFSVGSIIPSAGLLFIPVTPCRVADTRNSIGPFGGPTMTGGSTRSFAIPQSACSIPSTALAYSLNVTVVPDGPLGYLSLWPTGQTQPFVSTLNSSEGIVVANAALVPAGSGGAVSVYVSNQTDVILDINGYFATTTGTTSYSFYPATPCRIADTRNATGEFGGPSMFGGQTRSFPIPLSSCDIPPTARAYSLNVTVVPDGSLEYLTTWPTGGVQPYVSTLNSGTGKIVANAALVPAGTNESISVFVTNPTDVVLDGNGYFAAPGSLGALTFYPVTPCRVADTRNANGPFGGPELAGGSTRSFTIPASGCNIPSTAAAYSLNVTVVPSGVLYYLTAWPTGLSQPLVSTLNSFDGSVVANAAIVPAGTSGAISIYVTNPTQVILDINGYFAP